MARPRFGRVFQRKNTWWIAYYDGNGQEYRESSKSTKQTDAENLLKKRLAALHAGMPHQPAKTLIRELLDDLLHDYEINEKSSQWVKLLTDSHLAPAFGHLKTDQLTTRKINEYIQARRKAGIKNSTINRELSLLRRSYSLAAKSEPPQVTAVPNIPKLAENNVRKGFFEHHEYEALHAALPPHVKPILTFAYYTGTRRGEILSLQWDQVDLNAGLVRLEPGTTKNKDARIIPLTTDLQATLQALKVQRDQHDPHNPYVFTYHGKRLRTITTAWANACTTAGLINDKGKPTKLFHDLRRTGVRNLVRAGVPEAVAMRISGHRTRSVFDRYNIVTENDLHSAAKKLTEYLKK